MSQNFLFAARNGERLLVKEVQNPLSSTAAESRISRVDPSRGLFAHRKQLADDDPDKDDHRHAMIPRHLQLHRLELAPTFIKAISPMDPIPLTHLETCILYTSRPAANCLLPHRSMPQLSVHAISANCQSMNRIAGSNTVFAPTKET